MTRYALWLLLGFVALLPAPASAQGLILGAPAQGNAGGGMSAVTVTGDGLTGDGSAGTPLAVAADLERVVDGYAIASDGAFDFLGLGALTASGWRLTPTSASVLTVHEGDGTDPAGVESLNLGATTGWPSLQTAAALKATPAYSFVGDPNNGWYRAAADEQGFATAGVERLLINDDGDIDIGFDGTAAPFGAEVFIGSADQNALCIAKAADDTVPARIQTWRTRGTLAAPSDIATGDEVFSLHVNARQAGSIQEWGRITMATDGTIGAADNPGRWEFWTCPDGSGTLVEQIRITNAGNLHLGVDQLIWAGAITSVGDTGLERIAAAVVEITDGSTGRGALSVDVGAAATPALRIAASSTGYYGVAGTSLSESIGGTEELRLTSTGLDLGPGELRFGGSIGTPQGGFTMPGAGLMAATNGAGTVADFLADDIVIGAATTSGWRINSNSSTIIDLIEGDDSEADDGDVFRFGNGSTTGRPAWIATDFSPSAPGHCFSGDTNTGYGSVEADAPAIAAEGQWRTIWSNQITLTDNTATSIVTIPLASGARVGGTLFLWVDVTNGTDHQVVSKSYNFAALDKAGTLQEHVAAESAAAFEFSAGTVNSSVTVLDGTNQISLQVTADTDLSTPTLTCRWELHLSHSTAGVAVTIP